MNIVSNEYNSNTVETTATPPYQGDSPVVISQSEIDESNKHKAKRARSVAQTPAYRDATTMNMVIIQVLMSCPKKLRVSCDNLDALSNTLLSYIAIAFDDPSARYAMLTESLAIVKTILVKLQLFRQLNVISKDDYHKVRSIGRSLIAQVSAWRNSGLRESPVGTDNNIR